MYITGSEYCLADIAMFNEVANTLGVLGLVDAGESIEFEYKEAIAIKYPCVSSWLNSLESISVIRGFQIQFENKYLGELKKINDI